MAKCRKKLQTNLFDIVTWDECKGEEMGNHKSKPTDRPRSASVAPKKKKTPMVSRERASTLDLSGEKPKEEKKPTVVEVPPPKKDEKPASDDKPPKTKPSKEITTPTIVVSEVKEGKQEIDAITAAMDPESNHSSPYPSELLSTEQRMIWSNDSISILDSCATVPGFEEAWKESGMFPVNRLPTDLNYDPEKNPNDIDNEISFLPPVAELEALQVLNENQTSAVRYVVLSSKTESEKQLPNLLKRAITLGFTEVELRRTLRYIRDEAPIIVHLNFDKVLAFLLKDTHYRNQFETNTSGGYLSAASRTEWEDRLFNKIYSASKPFDRCKYGVLNIVNDPAGVKACNSYGDSYLQLKKVRLRTTFSDKDTSNADSKVASCEYCAHVLNTYTNEELIAVIKVANGKVNYVDSALIAVYKEIQIHGPIELATHIKSIHVNPRHKSGSQVKEIDELGKKFGCDVIWM